jgi:hypothetical protein
MNEHPTDLDQAEADEDILTYDVSDEALEAVAGMDGAFALSASARTGPAPWCC